MKVFLLLVFLILLFETTTFSQIVLEKSEFESSFKRRNVDGCITIFDKNENIFYKYNPERCETRYTPASTFKLLNTLIGLETGAITGIDMVIPWDGVKRSIEAWNRDQDLRSAIKYSCVPYYQEVARRIGEEKMREYVNASNYGNRDIRYEIDSFWLRGALRISPDEQIQFLRNIYNNNLPFTKGHIDILKEIIILDEQPSYTLLGKTGWGIMDEKRNIGWFVGYLEKNDNVYFYAVNIESKEPDEHFASYRKEIVTEAFEMLGIMGE